jgi:hypothetical protein
VALLVVGWRERAALADDAPPHPAPLPVTQRAEPA